MFFKSLLIAAMSLYATLQASEQGSKVFEFCEYISESDGILRVIEKDDLQTFQQVFVEIKSDEEGISNEMLEQGLDRFVSGGSEIKLIDAAGFFHSVGIFKYLVNNGKTPTKNTLELIFERRDVDVSKVYELIRLCEQVNVNIDSRVLEKAFRTFDEDLFAYACSKCPSYLCDQNSEFIVNSYGPSIEMSVENHEVSKVFGKTFQELKSEIVGRYPHFFEAFGESELDNISKVLKLLKFRSKLLGGINHSINLPILEKFAKGCLPKHAMPDAIVLATEFLLGGKKANLGRVGDSLKKLYGNSGNGYDAMTEFVELDLKTCYADNAEVSVKDFIGMAEHIEHEIFRQNSFIKTFETGIEFWKWQVEISDGGYLCDEFIRTEVQKFEDGLQNISELFEEETEEESE